MAELRLPSDSCSEYWKSKHLEKINISVLHRRILWMPMKRSLSSALAYKIPHNDIPEKLFDLTSPPAFFFIKRKSLTLVKCKRWERIIQNASVSPVLQPTDRVGVHLLRLQQVHADHGSDGEGAVLRWGHPVPNSCEPAEYRTESCVSEHWDNIQSRVWVCATNIWHASAAQCAMCVWDHV